MKKIGFIITFLIWLLTASCYLMMLLGLINRAYPEIGKDPNYFSDSDIFYASILFMLVNLVMGFICVKFDLIKSKKIKIGVLFIPVLLYVIALFSPIYLVYFSNIENLKIRADQRAIEGNWVQAMDIYCFIKPRNNKKNSNILRIQSWLKKAGYYNYEIDGIANHKIPEKLKHFQSENNLKPDGYIGEATQFKLFNKIFKKQLDSIKSINNIKEINIMLDKFILSNEIIEYDNTKAILFGIMFRESLSLEDNELSISNLREAVKKVDKFSYRSNGRFDNGILEKLLNIENKK